MPRPTSLPRQASILAPNPTALTTRFAWQAFIALVVLTFFWRQQVRFRPYPFDFQNRLEAWLFGANVVLVALGILYTALAIKLITEVAMIAVLVSSLFLAAVYVCITFRTMRTRGSPPATSESAHATFHRTRRCRVQRTNADEDRAEGVSLREDSEPSRLQELIAGAWER